METEYVHITEPTLNCIDMDMRLRGILLKHISSKARYDFSYKAADALTKRAKEVTPTTIEMLLRAMPDTFEIINRIWHEFPEEIMDRIIRNEYWDSKDCNGYTPKFIDDYILIHGEQLLEKYASVNMIVSNLLARIPGACCGTPGVSRAGTMESPMTSPATFLKYYKRFRSKMPKMWVDRHRRYVIENLGRYVTQGSLNIVAPEHEEVKDESPM